MSQLLLYHSRNGISLSADSRAVEFHSGKHAKLLQVQKLFHLAPNVIVATVGAGYGILLCEDFKSYVYKTGLQDFESIAAKAPSFFRRGTELVRGRNAYTPEHNSLNRVYFLMAGLIPDRVRDPFRFLLLASEGQSDPVHIVEASNVVTIPRRVGIEYLLTRLSRSRSTLDEIERLFERFLVKLSDADDGIGPPFHFARITSGGIRIRTQRKMRRIEPDRIALR